MSFDPKSLNLAPEDIIDIDEEVMSHLLWFKVTPDIKKDAPSKVSFDMMPVTDVQKTLPEPQSVQNKNDSIKHSLTFKEICHIIAQSPDHLLLLMAFYYYRLTQHVVEEEKDNISRNAQDFLNALEQDDYRLPENLAVIFEAYMVYEDFEIEAEEYYDNPIYYLMDDTECELPSYIFMKAENLSESAIIRFFAEFCDYNSETLTVELRDEKKISPEQLIETIERLARSEEID